MYFKYNIYIFEPSANVLYNQSIYKQYLIHVVIQNHTGDWF